MKCMGRDFFYVSCKFVVKTLPVRVTDTDSVKKEVRYMSYSPKGWFVGLFFFVWLVFVIPFA